MPETVADDDLPLVRRAQEGDGGAFDEIVRKHQSMITAILHRFAPDRGELEDLVQDTFVRAWRGLDRWRPERPFTHWLKRIAVNTGHEYCRRQSRRPLARAGALPAPDYESIDPAPADPADRHWQAAEEAHFILGHATPEDRTLLTLLYLNEWSLAEIAEHLGWSPAKTKIKAFRARKRLRAILAHYGYTGP